MTARELNARIKRLKKRVNKFNLHWNNLNELSQFKRLAYEKEEKEIFQEIRDCYYADNAFQYISKESVLILLRLNLRFRPIPLHKFGLEIKL